MIATFRVAPCWLALTMYSAGCERTASASTGHETESADLVQLRYQGNAGLVTYPELAEDLGFLAPLTLVHVGNTISGPQDLMSVATGDTDFGVAFNGAIVKLVAAKAPIEAVIGLPSVDAESWSGFYVLDETPITKPHDFLGKKVAVNTLGAHHEFVLREYLRRGGLSTSELEKVTLVPLPPASTEQALRARQVDVAVLGMPFRDLALERGGIHPVFSDYQLFGAMTSASYVVRQRFAREHPKAVARFVEGVARAIDWARATPRADLIARMERIIHERGRNEDAAALRHFRAVRSDTRGGLLTEAHFQRWIDWLERERQLTPGQLRARDLFTNRFNPHRE
jgi:ABC-type nitrate/sulfonate/bicarbonate transport system substrate-binding protein